MRAVDAMTPSVFRRWTSPWLVTLSYTRQYDAVAPEVRYSPSTNKEHRIVAAQR
jgi:hypothetical protein